MPLDPRSESLLHKKIDDILWSDWHPIGVNDVDDARTEYQSYVPEILDLVISGANHMEIANRLFQLEIENMGLIGSMEHCIAVADKILGAFRKYQM